MEAYAEIIEEFEDSLAPEMPEPERFVPTTDAEFEWAMRKRSRANAKAADLEEHLAHEVMLLQQAFGRRIKEQRETAEFFTDMIERGIEAMEPDGKGKRTVKTVVGTVYTRTTDHIEWPDDDALVSWAKEHTPEAVKVKESVNKAYLKTHLKETGEAPDGTVVEPRTTVVIKEA